MNTQIKRLLEQSGLQPYYNGQEVDIAKFAELIIRECGLFCGHDYEGVLAMFKHFGVEE